MVKDPRVCRFLPLWLSVLEEMRVKPGLVLNLRHPLENARSLITNDGFDLRKAFLFWLSHYREAFGASAGVPNVVITFDQLLADPVSTLNRISDTFSLDYPDSLESKYMDILSFVRPEMKHHHSGQSVSKEEARFDHFSSLYEQIRLLCMERATPITADAGKTEGVLQYSQERLPPVLQQFSPEEIAVNTRKSPREKASLVSSHLFNDILLLIGDHERENNSQRIQRERMLLSSTRPGTTLFVQIYFPQDQEEVFTENNSKKILLAPMEWQEIRVQLSDAVLIRKNGLRLAPLNTGGVVHISKIRFINIVTGETVLDFDKPDKLQQCDISGGAFALSDKEGLTLFVFDQDPQVFLPPMPDLPDCPLELRIWIKAQTSQEEVKQQSVLERKKREELETSKAQLESKLASVQESLESSRAELASQNKLREELATSEFRLEADLESMKAALNSSRAELASEAKKREELETSKAQLEADLIELNNKVFETQTQLSSLNSLSEHEKYKNSQLTVANSRLSSLNDQYARKNGQLEYRMDQLQRDFKALMGSRRWQVGNAVIRFIEIILFKGRKPGAADHMQQIFNNLLNLNQQMIRHDRFINEDRLIGQLEKDVHALSDSVRWKVGNAVIRGVEIMSFRGKPRLALDHMNQIFKDFHSARDQWQGGAPEINQRWIYQLESDYRDILSSKRWQIGNFLVRGVEMLLLRKKKPMSTDHMEKLFDQFRQSRYTDYSHEFIEKDSNVEIKNYEQMRSDNFNSENVFYHNSNHQTEAKLREENEFLLLQLHQVQEELEIYYLKYQESKSSMLQNSQELKA